MLIFNENIELWKFIKFSFISQCFLKLAIFGVMVRQFYRGIIGIVLPIYC